MPDCEGTCEADGPSSSSSDSTNTCAIWPITDHGADSSSVPQKPQKDPRKIARKYQLELCKKAMEENIIVYLGTGCGKTHIAVLLIYELGHLIRKPQKNVCFFLRLRLPSFSRSTMPMGLGFSSKEMECTLGGSKQAKVIEESTDFKVGIFYGSSKHLKNHYDWEKEIEQYEVFYKANDGKLPRIFGMTASPVVGQGASSQANLPRSINSLENLLDAKVYSVEDKEELEHCVASPVVKIYEYGPVANGTSSYYMTYCSKLEEIKHTCISELHKKVDECQSVQGLRNTKKVLSRMHDNVVFCLENLGLWGALQACQILLSGDPSEWNALIEEEGNISNDSFCDRYLAQAANFLAAVCTTGAIELKHYLV
ncbi:hypothetical protein GH714_012834 [Hevea brasiliensis]|uniref:Helicase/UvrB N-terminal domain-containing protein n=1 Tax=Hevea brasiliensis TaxID=3981 RepID=A0A6A6MB43_HEVBR|nr:hypothetical protein GH714_012834 [Hevea brasiliensis]